MELLTCPACGCRVQAADALLGRRVRCAGCGHAFTATAEASPPPSCPPQGGEGRRSPSPLVGEGRGGGDDLGERGPFCPGCGRRVRWDDPRCPFCGEELEPEDEEQARRRARRETRRDYEPHRGPLVLGLGNVSMVVGGLSVCTLGAGALVSIPLGVLAWTMARRDLRRMRDGRMDPTGRRQTEIGRTGGIAGALLGLIFAAFYAALYLAG